MVSSALVPLFLTEILAFGTAAPLESVTVPPNSVFHSFSSNFLLIQSRSTLRSFVREPDTLRGSWKAPIRPGTDGSGHKGRLSTATSIQVCAYFLSQELAALQ